MAMHRRDAATPSGTRGPVPHRADRERAVARGRHPRVLGVIRFRPADGDEIVAVAKIDQGGGDALGHAPFHAGALQRPSPGQAVPAVQVDHGAGVPDPHGDLDGAMTEPQCLARLRDRGHVRAPGPEAGQGPGVRISGRFPSSADTLELVAALPCVSGARLAAPVQRDGDRERFAITFDYRREPMRPGWDRAARPFWP